MSNTPTRATIRRTLTRGGFTASKKIKTRVKGLPLTSRGFTVEQFEPDMPVQVGVRGGASRLTASDVDRQLGDMSKVIADAGFLVHREGDVLIVTGTDPGTVTDPDTVRA